MWTLPWVWPPKEKGKNGFAYEEGTRSLRHLVWRARASRDHSNVKRGNNNTTCLTRLGFDRATQSSLKTLQINRAMIVERNCHQSAELQQQILPKTLPAAKVETPRTLAGDVPRGAQEAAS